MSADEIIELLDLQPHPSEGGFFRETYRSRAEFEPGEPFPGRRSHSTAIYYLLTPSTFSELHRLPGDEVFHFYLGDPVEMLELHSGGEASVTVLGPELDRMTVQHVVRGGTWQGSRLVQGGEWALLGTTMAPGFSYEDYETGTAELLERFSSRATMIAALLRPGDAA
ncbi:MAG: cupin domain-containing protein [Gemmatimonadota bacterium]